MNNSMEMMKKTLDSRPLVRAVRQTSEPDYCLHNVTMVTLTQMILP